MEWPSPTPCTGWSEAWWALGQPHFLFHPARTSPLSGQHNLITLPLRFLILKLPIALTCQMMQSAWKT